MAHHGGNDWNAATIMTNTNGTQALNEQSSRAGQAYFDVEGDRESARSQKAELSALTWRGDPTDTHSDWTIVVVTTELETTTYHVHKSVLCFGPRQSKYFSRIILNHKPKHGKESAQTPTIKVDLDQRDAQNFETLLDYVYAPSAHMLSNNDATVLTAASTLTSPSLFTVPTSDDDGSCLQEDEFITTRTAVSLRYLARRFEVDSFILAVNRFIQKDLNFSTGPVYLTKGWEYNDVRLVASAQRLCAENFEHLDVKALTKLPIHLFRVIVKSLESFDSENQELSMFLSEVVCRYLEKNQKELSADVLLELTDPMLMPYIASEPAIGFTSLVKNLESQEATKHWDKLALLCRRCAKAVVREYGWSDFSVNAAVDEYLGNSSSNKRVSRVDSLLFATSFAAALEQAQDDYELLSVEQEQMETTVRALHNSISLMEELNDRKDSYMTKQQQVMDDAKRQILELRQQLHDIKEQQRKSVPHLAVRFSPETVGCPPVRLPPPILRGASSEDASASDGQKCFTTEEIVRDLISPSEVEGAMMALRKSRRREQKSREEMRSQKSLV